MDAFIDDGMKYFSHRAERAGLDDVFFKLALSAVVRCFFLILLLLLLTLVFLFGQWFWRDWGWFP